MALNEWMSVEITIASELADPASDFCHERGSSGIVLEDPAPGLTRIRAYFPAFDWQAVFADVKNHIEALIQAFPNVSKPIVCVIPVKTENWATMWQEHFKPIQVGHRLVISPPWVQPDYQDKEIVLIEPAEAFGTGTHETTQGCLILLQEALYQDISIPDDWTMLDVGCGSGILAIAGVKLGLKHVIAIDNDPIAVEAAHKNANLNNVNNHIEFLCLGLEAVKGRWDLIMANLDPKTLLSHKDQILNSFKQFLVISGVPVEKWNEVKSEFQKENVRLFKEITRSEWGCGLFTKP
jgi:ribosomal protein L11 methyltransferase